MWFPVQSVSQPLCWFILLSPETLGEAQTNSRVQLQFQQLLGNVFDSVASVVELRAGGVSVDPLVVDLQRRGRDRDRVRGGHLGSLEKEGDSQLCMEYMHK